MLMTEARGRAAGPDDGVDPDPDDVDDGGAGGSSGTDRGGDARTGASTLSDEARRASMRAVEDVVAGASTASSASPGSFRGWLRSRLSRRDERPGEPSADGSVADEVISDEGMATAEYAIATVAAAGFAGLLLVILRSDEVRGLLLDIVRGALSM